jgi:glutaminase
MRPRDMIEIVQEVAALLEAEQAPNVKQVEQIKALITRGGYYDALGDYE